MRIVHFSDIHIGIESYGRLDPATGLSTRFLDFLSAFDQVVDYVLHNDVHLVIFSGDAYKTRNPTPTHQQEFAQRIWQMAKAGVPVFLLVGNHDAPNVLGRATTVDIFDTLAVQRVTVGKRIDTYPIDTAAGRVQVVALPWITRSGILTKEDIRQLPIERVDEAILQRVQETIDLQIQGLSPDIPAILVAHGSVQGAVYGSERSLTLGNDIVIPASLTNRPVWSYVALGHIHKHQRIHDNPPAVYAGSLERIDFSEKDDQKGFVVVDIDDTKAATCTFCPVKARRFVEINVDVEAGQDPTACALEAIARAPIRDAVVRVMIRSQTEAPVREDEVRRALREAYYIAAIRREVERPVRTARLTANPEGLTPLQALAAYLQSKNMAAEWVQTLIAYGERLIREETGDGPSG